MQRTDPAARLEAVLLAENAALERHDAAAAAALLPEKLEAAGALAAAGLSVEDCERLGALAAENRLLLARAIAVQGRILAMVARAAQAAPPVARYGHNGAVLPEGGALALTRQA